MLAQWACDGASIGMMMERSEESPYLCTRSLAGKHEKNRLKLINQKGEENEKFISEFIFII